MAFVGRGGAKALVEFFACEKRRSVPCASTTWQSPPVGRKPSEIATGFYETLAMTPVGASIARPQSLLNLRKILK
jgi:hypothetical protein